MSTILGNTITEPKVAFSFENDQLTLYCGLDPVSLLGKDSIIGTAINTPYKYYFRLPSVDCQAMIGNVHIETLYYLEGFEDNQGYNQMTFSFPALDYFLANILFEKSNQSFTAESKCCIWKYECNFKNRDLSLLFSTQRKSVDSTNYKYTWCGKLDVRCEQSFDSDFAYHVVQYVRGLFSFIYNRADIVIGKVSLSGTKVHFKSRVSELKTNNDVEKHSSPVHCTLRFTETFNNSRHDFLNFNTERHIGFSIFASKFDELIRIIFNDKVTFSELTQVQRLVYDLNHVLTINRAFEHYFKYLDDSFKNEGIITTKCKIEKDYKVSDLTLANKLRYIYNPNTLIGKEQRKGVEIIRMSDIKWNGTNTIFDYYNDDSFREKLISSYVEWRNAEAHAKEFDLSSKDPQILIESIRFVECMNYCVVLKIAGYSDEDIRSVIDRLLFDQKHRTPLPQQQ